MNVNFTVGIFSSLLENMVVKIYEVDITGATSEVGIQVIPERDGSGVPTVGAGHQVPYQATFSGLDFLTHEVRLYTASGVFLDKYTHGPSKDTINLFTPIRFKIGDGGPNTPAAGDTAYVNGDMAGVLYDEYIALRTGYGPLIEGVHIVNNIGGGLQLFQPGDVFGDNEEWTIIMQPKVIRTPVNDSVVGKQWGPTVGNPEMFLDVAASIAYVPAHLRKLIRLAGDNALYRFESSDVPPIGYIFRFTNFGTPGSELPKVQFNNAPLLWGGTTKIELEIPLYTTPEFVWDGVNWNVSNYQLQAPSTPVSGDIIYTGDVNIGDIHEDIYTVNHGQNILFPYRAIIMIMSRSADHAKDNTITFAIRENSFTANSFQFTTQEIFGEIQNVSYRYWLVKL